MLEGLVVTEGADVEFEFLGCNRKRPIAVLAISSRSSIPMLSASRRARGLALVVVEENGVQRRMEELVGRELVEVADFFEPYVVEAAHTSSEGISILSRRKHGSTSLPNSSDGEHPFGPGIGRS